MSRKTIQSNSEILQTNPLNWILLCGLELINVILLDWSSSHKATCFQTQGAEQQYENKQHALSYVRWVKRNTVHKDTTHNSFRPTPKRIHIFITRYSRFLKKTKARDIFSGTPLSVCWPCKWKAVTFRRYHLCDNYYTTAGFSEACRWTSLTK